MLCAVQEHVHEHGHGLDLDSRVLALEAAFDEQKLLAGSQQNVTERLEVRLRKVEQELAALLQQGSMNASMGDVHHHHAAIEPVVVVKEIHRTSNASSKPPQDDNEHRRARPRQSKRMSLRAEPVLDEFGEEIKLDDCHLGRTLWDSAILIGLPELGGVGASLALLLSLLLNMVVQLFLTVIVLNNNNFFNTELWQIQKGAASMWRTGDAHNYLELGTNGRSLAWRVCEMDPSLSVAGSQSDLLVLINRYLGLSKPQDFEWNFVPGCLLSLVCQLIFVFMILRELRSVASAIQAAMSIPRGTTEINGIHLTAISLPRLILVISVQMVRAGVAVALLVAGIFWLSYTASVQDLILNAAALGFVIDFDEIIWATTVPSRVHKFVEVLAPTKFRTSSYHLEAFLPLVLLPCILIPAVFLLLVPNAESMAAVKREMCTGDLDFAVSDSPAGLMVNFPASATFQTGALWNAAVRERIHAPDVSDVQKSVSARDLDQWSVITESTLADLAQSAACVDLLWPPAGNLSRARRNAPAHISAIRYMINDPAKDTTLEEAPFNCSDYRADCNRLGLLRLACPVTCGCDNSRSGSIHRTVAAGCPQACVYSDKLHAPCEDMEAPTPEWYTYFGNLRDTLMRNFDDFASNLETYLSDTTYLDLGCSNSSDLVWQMCSTPMRSFLALNDMSGILGFCPQTCCTPSDSEDPDCTCVLTFG